MARSAGVYNVTHLTKPMQRMMPQDPQTVPKVQDTTEDRNSARRVRSRAPVPSGLFIQYTPAGLGRAGS